MTASLSRTDLARAVRTSLAELAARFPGRLIEVRVPPWGAVQIGMPHHSGGHRRGTPSNVVETDPHTWLQLYDGSLTWDEAVARHAVSASGVHADLRAVLAELLADR